MDIADFKLPKQLLVMCSLRNLYDACTVEYVALCAHYSNVVEVNSFAKNLFFLLLVDNLKEIERNFPAKTQKGYKRIFHDAFVKTEYDVRKAITQGFMEARKSAACQDETFLASNIRGIHQRFINMLSEDNDYIWRKWEADFLASHPIHHYNTRSKAHTLKLIR